MQYGRIRLETSEPYVDYDNVIDILRKVVPIHEQNVEVMKRLDEFEKGCQPLMRTKTYRPDIDVQTNDNIANEIVNFKTSFHWGNPITIVQRGDVEENSNVAKAVSELNKCYEAENIRAKTQHLARNVEVTGLGYTFVDMNTDEEDISEGGSYFKIESLEYSNAFVVYSSFFSDKRPMMGVTYRTNNSGVKCFTVFTRDERFELEGYEHTPRSGELNPLGEIPVIEWFRSYDGMGCFEREIKEMNTLNLMVSDLANDIDQETQAIWHGNDVEFPKVQLTDEEGNVIGEEEARPKTNDWIMTQTTPDGRQPFIKPLSIGYDYTGMLNSILSKRSLILQRCNVPTRNDNSGGSTGIAMDSATGWSSAETEAQKQQNIMEGCKVRELRAVLKAIKNNPYVPTDSPLLDLKYTDLKPSIKRSKSFELTTKINFFATAVSHGISGLHALKAMNAFEDVAEVWKDSKELIEKYQSSIFDKTETVNAVGGIGEEAPNSDRREQDYSDQIENSPELKNTADTIK